MRSQSICSVDGCGKPRKNRVQPWCGKHLQRYRRHGDPLYDPRVPWQERFWKLVDTSAGPGACWPWIAARDRDGYGFFKLAGKMLKAHRVAWKLSHGEIPAGVMILHLVCDNPPCCNDAHLGTGDALLNNRDMTTKGRARYPGPTNPIRGERNPRALHTSEQVRTLKALLDSGVTPTDAAAQVGVKRELAYSLRYGRSWRHIVSDTSCAD